MKVGILTHYNVYNQGALLQMTAMHHWLKEKGHEPVVMTYEKNFDFREGEKEKNSGSLRAFPYYIRHYLLEKGLIVTAGGLGGVFLVLILFFLMIKVMHKLLK